MKFCSDCSQYDSSSLSGYGFCRDGKTPEQRSFMVRGEVQPCWLSKGRPGLVPLVQAKDQRTMLAA